MEEKQKVYALKIEKARDEGYFVTTANSIVVENSRYPNEVLCCGSLDKCCSYIEANIALEVK